MHRLGFRARVALLTASVVAVAVVLLSGALYLATSRSLVDQVDRQLAVVADLQLRGPANVRQLTAFVADLRSGTPAQRPGARGGPGERLVGRDPRFGGAVGVLQFVDADGTVLLGDDEAPLPVTAADLRVAAAGRTSPARFRTQVVDDVELRIHTVGLGQGVALQVARPLDEVGQARAAVGRLSLFAGGIGVALAGAAGLLLAGRIVRPVAALRRTADEVTRTGDLDHRIEVAGSDEIAGLATTFNEMLASLGRARAAQQQLVADASHELRTPLTSLRTNIEVLRMGGLQDADRTALLADVDGQLAEFGTLVGGLVELARGDVPPAAPTDVQLDLVVDRVVARARLNWRDVAIHLRTVPTVVRGAEDQLERAVANLVDNAAKYGEGRDVDVLVADGRVEVRDRGAGVPAGEADRVFERFYRSPEARGLPGSGLGLAIVAQVAASHGGEARLSPAPGGGTVAVLQVPTVR